MKYEVIVAGSIQSTCDTKEEAERQVNAIRNSIMGLVHPTDCIWIREKK